MNVDWNSLLLLAIWFVLKQPARCYETFLPFIVKRVKMNAAFFGKCMEQFVVPCIDSHMADL
jgi:hypothetical protein